MRSSNYSLFVVVFALSGALGCGTAAQSVSDQPDTPFKLATFEANGETSIGVVVSGRLFELAGASQHLVENRQVSAIELPSDMRTLIEEYDRLAPRLYQIANFFSDDNASDLGFVHAVDEVSIKAPIKYPWNLLAAAANYKAHAEGMGEADSDPPAEQSRPGRRGGFDPSRIAQIDPARDAPVLFAKSPRSCIIDPGEPYYVPPGRERIDWEGEMAVIMGKKAYLVSPEEAHDYVFGYSIVYDLSDRGGRTREVSMFPGPNWFDGKSVDRGAPFGPFIVPKEFLPNHENLRLVTRVNGVVMQDQTTSDLIWPEANLISYASSILSLYPGDVIATGTPAGTGAERGEFLKPGDVVEIELEGVGTLVTPIEAYKKTE